MVHKDAYPNAKRGLPLVFPPRRTFSTIVNVKNKFKTLYCDYSLTTNLDQILQERARNEKVKSKVIKENEAMLDLEEKNK